MKAREIDLTSMGSPVRIAAAQHRTHVQRVLRAVRTGPDGRASGSRITSLCS